MIAFFIKKSFFDGWDHLFSLILLNLGFILAVAVGFVLPGSIGLPLWATVVLGVLSLAAGAVCLGVLDLFGAVVLWSLVRERNAPGLEGI